MKKNIQYLFAAILLGLTFTSCGDGFLSRDPYGSTITQAQFEKLANQLEGSMRGIYSMMYAVSDHDEFGKRSIDMYGDLMCGDMALTSYTYGWFYTDEQLQGRTERTGYIWSYYYGMLHNVNAVLKSAQGGEAASADNVIKRIGSYGLPTVVHKGKDEVIYYTIDAKGDTLATYTESEALVANCYAQALTMRGYIYSNLVMMYCDESKKVPDFSKEKRLPLYTESNMDDTQPLASTAEVYQQIESDLTTAADYFAAFSEVKRTSKLTVDASVAYGILAYSYLNKGRPGSYGMEDTKSYTNARDYAQLAITNSSATILPRASLYETGFNNVSNVSWMWGQDVTVETAGGLASWFGQCDIHSYSYAWSGDTKAIDENLFEQIAGTEEVDGRPNHPFDGRQYWFNDGSQNSKYKLCPDGKFFSAANPTSTKADDIDREWLSDNVFMRIESMYLIAAEACYRLNDDAEAIKYLTAITDERIATGMESEYATYKSGLNHSNLLAEIEYNWRVEMWGEGYGLMTFRRLCAEVQGNKDRHRGANHSANGGSTITPGNDYVFQMPSAEGTYNPNINQ